MFGAMQVVMLISKCSESNGEVVQLGVVRALLTVTTAEHFVLHGDCLMQVLMPMIHGLLVRPWLPPEQP